MFSILDLADYAKESEDAGDLYSLISYLFSSSITPKTFFLERQEGFHFRPYFLVQIVNSRPIGRGAAAYAVEHSVLITALGRHKFESELMAQRIQTMFSNTIDTLIPKFDYEYSPPRQLPLWGTEDENNCVKTYSAIRVDPTSLVSQSFQEPDENWNSPVSFTMLSPRVPERCYTILRNVTVAQRNAPSKNFNKAVEASVSSNASIEYSIS